MGTKADNETRTVLKKLALFVPLFYVIYYVISVILVGGFKVPWNELGAYPFRIRLSEFSPSGKGSAALGAWLAMVITYSLTILLTFFVVRATRKSWDYVTTTSLLHLILCIIVNQAFPVNWVWWVTIIVASGVLSLAAEVTNYYLRDLREIKLDNV